MDEVTPPAQKHSQIGRIFRAVGACIKAVGQWVTKAISYLYKDPQPWLLELGVGGFLAGFFIFPNNFVHGLWFLFTILIPIWRWRRKELDAKIFDDTGFWLLAGFLIWTLGSSIIMSIPDVVFSDALVSLVDSAAILGLYSAIAILLRSKFQERRRLLMPFPVVGGIATLVSLAWFYGVSGNTFPTERLRNVFVHFDTGGLHPVVTGLICGCAAITGACLYTKQANWRKKTLLLACLGVLSAGVFFSHSRGAMLALGVSFAVYVLTRRDRSWVMPGIIIACVGITYLSIPGGAPGNLIDRADGGRLNLYGFLFAQMEGLPDLLFGKGLWAVDSATVDQIGWHAHHPHSSVVSTFFHGGTIGLALTVGLMGLGAFRAFSVYRKTGDGTWLVLLSFGVAGQLVDGSMPFSLLTLPRLEPILLLFPIAAASSVYCEYAREEQHDGKSSPSEAIEGQRLY